jgi:8-oxo-dGTP diphosphatase
MTQPILGASACIWRGGQVLLIKRGQAPGNGLWSLPGGKIELGEDAKAAALRELFEETQVVANLIDAMGPFKVWRDGILIYTITCFAGHYVSGEAVAGSDAAEVVWVYPQALSGLELAPNIAQAIAESAKVLKL